MSHDVPKSAEPTLKTTERDKTITDPRNEPGPSRWVRLRANIRTGGIAVAIIAAVGAIVVAAIEFGPTWIPIINGSSPELSIQRRILYMSLREFRDRRLDQKPFKQQAYVGLDNSTVRAAPTDLYDEAQYLDVLYLNPHETEEYVSELHSSGIADIDAVIPWNLRTTISRYDLSSGGELDYRLILTGGTPSEPPFHNYVILSRHYYNGYQYDGTVYQSDGGMDITYPTEEAILICDFTGLDYNNLLAKSPQPRILGVDDQPLPTPPSRPKISEV